MFADLATVMGGRIAEEEIFGYDKVSSGASGDIKQATKLARAMVLRWGMSDKLGPLEYEDDQGGGGYLGYSQSVRHSMSNETAKLIDSEIKRLVEGGLNRAREVIKGNVAQLHLIANALLELETLTGDEIRQLIDTGKIERPDQNAPGNTLTPVKGSAIPKAGKRFVGVAA